MNMKTVPRHGGNLAELARIAGCGVNEITDFSISVNPLGAPDCMRNAAMREWDNIQRYPEPRAESLLAAASTRFGLPEKMLVAGNGANQLIHAIPLALKLRRAVIAAPAYGDYERACRNAGMEIINVVSPEENDFIPDAARLAEVTDESLIFIGNPGNPAGTYMSVKISGNLRCRVRIIFSLLTGFCRFFGV
jgi:histidinol-phosphate/aromatic aminotransferase/cobyric acid decarboxylase-like protein